MFSQWCCSWYTGGDAAAASFFIKMYDGELDHGGGGGGGGGPAAAAAARLTWQLSAHCMS